MFTSWMAFGIAGLVLSQLIIMLVTIYFHRACSHRAVVLSPGLNRVCRFLAWFLISMDPQEFAAVHRKHHAKCDTEEDPHSPANHKWYGVLFGGLSLYRKEAANPQTIEQYGKGLPVDPWEGFYRRYPTLGIFVLAALLVGLLGWKGVVLWGLMMVWIPFWAAGVINGLGHHVGYRNFQTDDLSTNLVPWGVWVGGEELHNNHHAYPASAKFSQKAWEIDLGWWLIVILRRFGQVQVREEVSTAQGLALFLRHRHQYLSQFHFSLQNDVAPLLRQYGIKKWSQLSRWNDRRQRLSAARRRRVAAALSDPLLMKIQQLEEDLRQFWKERGHVTQERLEMWKQQARSFGYPSLTRFVDSLPAS